VARQFLAACSDFTGRLAVQREGRQFFGLRELQPADEVFDPGQQRRAALNSSTPNPISSAVNAGSPAISPQTLTQTLCAWAASTVV